ncbi:hypothetical protein [Nocardia fluminea]|uniref:hypothetical protein n=1 Tax=Nocardia fluminea TaxID=134984 RepID=UPI00365CFC3F
MHYVIELVDRQFGRSARHALGFGAALTVAVILRRLAAERKAEAPAPVPMVDDVAAVVRSVLITTPDPARPKYPPAPDSEVTKPLPRAELMAMLEVNYAQVTDGAR